MRFASLAFLLFLPAASQESAVKKLLPKAERIKKLTLKLDKEAKERVETTLGAKLAPGDASAQVYQCRAIVPMVSPIEHTIVRVVFLTVKGPKGAIKLGVAVAHNDDVLGKVAVLSDGGEKALGEKAFLKQFEGMHYSEHIEEPASTLEESLKKAKSGGDKELAMLVRMNEVMRLSGPAWDRLNAKVEKKDKGLAADADAVAKLMKESVDLVSAASFMPGSSQDRFKEYAESAIRDLGKVKAAAAAGKWDEAYKDLGEADQQGCARCHGSYTLRFQEARLENGMGNGFFSTKLDVQVPEPKLESSYQAVATGIRKAILLAFEAR